MAGSRFVLALLMGTCLSASAALGQQQQTPSPALPPTITPATPGLAQAPANSEDEKSGVHIGPGDLLDISVYNVPELSQKVRVNDSGDAYLPLVGYVHLAGLTVPEAQAKLEQSLTSGGYLNNPHVQIMITESATEGIALMGEIIHPGIYPVYGAKRLFDVIAAAGGLTDKAGRTVTITHRDKPTAPVTIPLSLDAEHSAESNVEVFPGDTILVSKAGIIYVVGEVGHPSGFVMDHGGTLSILQAISMAGGTNRTAALDHARIVRKGTKGPENIEVPLKKILQAKAPDMQLQDDDILFIPTSAAKNAASRTMEAILQMATGVSLRHF